MKNIVRFKPPIQQCRILVQNGVLSQAGRLVSFLRPDQVFVLTNTTLRELHYPKLENSLSVSGLKLARPIVVKDGEKNKDLVSLEYCYDFLAGLRADRQSMLITLGGGVITDLGGMVAATYMRGIKLVHIPTSLLAQVDASLGGKTALNHPSAKNIIGSFYHPGLILIDPSTLVTLEQRQCLNGLAEVIKIGLVANPLLFRFIEANVDKILVRDRAKMTRMIQAAVRQKLEIVKLDPHENGLRKILNFGHTTGHALETLHGYNELLHGEAVSLGMLVALKLSADLKLGSCESLRRVKNLLEAAKLPTKIKKPNAKTLWRIMALDKKADFGKINFVLLEKIGKPVVRQVSFEQFKKAMGVLN